MDQKMKHWKRCVTRHNPSHVGEVFCATCNCSVLSKNAARHNASDLHNCNVLLHKLGGVCRRDAASGSILCSDCGWKSVKNRDNTHFESFRNHVNGAGHAILSQSQDDDTVQEATPQAGMSDEALVRHDAPNQPAEEDILDDDQWPCEGEELKTRQNVRHAIVNFVRLSSFAEAFAQTVPTVPPSEEHIQAAREKFNNAWTKLGRGCCATCGLVWEKTEEEQTRTLSFNNTIVADLLRYPEDPEAKSMPVIDPEALQDCPLHVCKHNGALYCVDPDLFQPVTAEFEVCGVCYAALTGDRGTTRAAPRVPLLSYRAGWDFGKKPDSLPELRPEEISAIALVFPFTVLRQIRHSKSVESNFTEQTISFPETHPKELQSFIDSSSTKVELPRLPSNVVMTFIGTKSQREAVANPYFMEQHCIRKDVIEEWLAFLQKHNVYYKRHASVTEPAMQAVSERTVEHITNATVADSVSVVAAAVVAGEANPTTAPQRASHEHYMIVPDGPPEESATEQMASAVEAHQFEQQTDEERDHARQQQARGTRTINLNRAVTEFTHCDVILAGGMPHLFFCCTEVLRRQIQKPLHPSRVRHMLLNKEQRFAKDGNFLFFHFNSRRRHSLARSIQASPKAWNIGKELLEDEDLANKLREAELNPSPAGDALVAKMNSSLQFLTRKVPFSNGERKGKLHNLMGLHAFMGHPNVFVTISPFDGDIQVTLRRITNGDKDKMDILMANTSVRVQAVQSHPAYAANSFSLLVNAIVRHLFGVPLCTDLRSLTKEKISGWGIFGLAKAVFGVFETQGRGSLHLHCLVWGAPLVDYISDCLDGYKDSGIKLFASSVCTALTPNCPVQLPEPFGVNYRATLETCPDDWSNKEVMDCRDYYCTRSLIHKHHIQCFKHRLYEHCRYRYSRQVCDETGLHRLDSGYSRPVREAIPRASHTSFFGYKPIDVRAILLLLERSYGESRDVSEYNPVLQRLLGCNTNVQLLGCECSAQMTMLYLVKYLTKPVTPIVATHAAVRHAQDRAGYKSANEDHDDVPYAKRVRAALTVTVNRLANNALGKEEISPQFASLMLLNVAAEVQTLPTANLQVSALVRNYRDIIDQAPPDTETDEEQSDDTDAASSSEEEGLAPEDPDELDQMADPDNTRGDFAPLMGKRDSHTLLINDIATNFLHRGKKLAVLNYYFYKAVVKAEILKPDARGDEYDEDKNEHDDDDDDEECSPKATQHTQGRFESRRIRFARSHPEYECLVQVLLAVPVVPSPLFVPRWSHMRDTKEEKWDRRAKSASTEHAAYFFCLFAPISATTNYALSVEQWRYFLKNLKLAAVSDRYPTKLIPWPREVCFVLLNIIEIMRLGLKDGSFKESRKMMGQYWYNTAMTKSEWLKSVPQQNREMLDRIGDAFGDGLDLEDRQRAIDEAIDHALAAGHVGGAGRPKASDSPEVKLYIERFQKALELIQYDDGAYIPVAPAPSVQEQPQPEPEEVPPHKPVINPVQNPTLASDIAIQAARDEIHRRRVVGYKLPTGAMRKIDFDKDQEHFVLKYAPLFFCSNPTASGRKVCLHGGPGSGKSEVLLCLIAVLESLSSRVKSYAAFGMAAMNIGGETICSGFSLPFSPNYDVSLLPLNKRQALQKEFAGVRTIAIDEVSCLGTGRFWQVSKRLGEIACNPHVELGGYNIVVQGDFFQLPVIGDTNFFFGPKSDPNARTLGIHDFDFVQLKTQHRCAGDADEDDIAHRQMLVDLRDPAKCKESWKAFLARMEKKGLPKSGRSVVLVCAVLEYSAACKLLTTQFAQRFKKPVVAIRFTHRGPLYYHVEGQPAIVNENMRRLKLMNGSPVTEVGLEYHTPDEQKSAEKLIKECAHGEVVELPFPVKGINVQTSTGTRVLLGRSTRGGANEDKEEKISPHQLQPAWSYTFHKAQGATIENTNVILDLNVRPAPFKTLITHAAIYVAISRVRSAKQLFIMPPNDPATPFQEAFKHITELKPYPEMVEYVNAMAAKRDGEMPPHRDRKDAKERAADKRKIAKEAKSADVGSKIVPKRPLPDPPQEAAECVAPPPVTRIRTELQPVQPDEDESPFLQRLREYVGKNEPVEILRSMDGQWVQLKCVTAVSKTNFWATDPVTNINSRRHTADFDGLRGGTAPPVDDLGSTPFIATEAPKEALMRESSEKKRVSTDTVSYFVKAVQPILLEYNAVLMDSYIFQVTIASRSVKTSRQWDRTLERAKVWAQHAHSIGAIVHHFNHYFAVVATRSVGTAQCTITVFDSIRGYLIPQREEKVACFIAAVETWWGAAATLNPSILGLQQEYNDNNCFFHAATNAVSKLTGRVVTVSRGDLLILRNQPEQFCRHIVNRQPMRLQPPPPEEGAAKETDVHPLPRRGRTSRKTTSPIPDSGCEAKKEQ
jgi:hypothetical protein